MDGPIVAVTDTVANDTMYSSAISMEGEEKGDGHQYGRKPRTPCRANPNSWETHIVRKRWDIGLLRALSPGIMMMMIRNSTVNNYLPISKSISVSLAIIINLL